MTKEEYKEWYFEQYGEYPSQNLVEKFQKLNYPEEPKNIEQTEGLDLSFLD